MCKIKNMELKETLLKLNIDVRENVKMSEHTTMKCGGNAILFVAPKTFLEMTQVVEFFNKNQVEFFVLGGGSNLVVSDKGFSRPVISTEKLNHIEYLQGKLICQSGVLMDTVADFCAKNCLSGMEMFSGLPGTCGGGVYMNARCYEKNISDVLCQVTYLDLLDCKVKVYEMQSSDWEYKKSPFQTNKWIVLEVVYKVEKLSDNSKIVEKNNFYVEDRRQKGHFKFPSAGSVFKNNRSFGKPSGKLIDEAGLKGFTIGGAQIAPWHGNFIINCGNAKSDDILALVNKAKETVKEKFGFELECEILFAGD